MVYIDSTGNPIPGTPRSTNLNWRFDIAPEDEDDIKDVLSTYEQRASRRESAYNSFDRIRNAIENETPEERQPWFNRFQEEAEIARRRMDPHPRSTFGPGGTPLDTSGPGGISGFRQPTEQARQAGNRFLEDKELEYQQRIEENEQERQRLREMGFSQRHIDAFAPTPEEPGPVQAFKRGSEYLVPIEDAEEPRWVQITEDALNNIYDSAGFGRGYDRKDFLRDFEANPLETLAKTPSISLLPHELASSMYGEEVQELPLHVRELVAEARLGEGAGEFARQLDEYWQENGELPQLSEDPQESSELWSGIMASEKQARQMKKNRWGPVTNFVQGALDEVFGDSAPIIPDIGAGVVGAFERTGTLAAPYLVPGLGAMLVMDGVSQGALGDRVKERTGLDIQSFVKRSLNDVGIYGDDPQAEFARLADDLAIVTTTAIGGAVWSQAGRTFLQKLVADVGFSGAADLLLTGSSLAISGVDPKSDEFWETLTFIAGAGAAGAAGGELLGRAGRAGVTSRIGRGALEESLGPLFTGGSALAIAKAYGLEDEDAAALAAAVAGGTLTMGLLRRFSPEMARRFEESIEAHRKRVNPDLSESAARTASRVEGGRLSPDLAYTSIEEIPTPAPGRTVYYHGTGAGSLREPWEGMFVTPNKADAFSYANADARARTKGGIRGKLQRKPTPKVYAFEIDDVDVALKETGVDDFATARGAKLVANPEAIRVAGRDVDVPPVRSEPSESKVRPEDVAEMPSTFNSPRTPTHMFSDTDSWGRSETAIYDIGEYIVNVVNRDDIELSLWRGVESFGETTGRFPGGGSLSDMAEVGRFVRDLAEQNPDKKILVDPTDDRRAAVYKRVGFVQRPSGTLELDLAKFREFLSRHSEGEANSTLGTILASAAGGGGLGYITGEALGLDEEEKLGLAAAGAGGATLAGAAGTGVLGQTVQDASLGAARIGLATAGPYTAADFLGADDKTKEILALGFGIPTAINVLGSPIVRRLMARSQPSIREMMDGINIEQMTDRNVLEELVGDKTAAGRAIQSFDKMADSDNYMLSQWGKVLRTVVGVPLEQLDPGAKFNAQFLRAAAAGGDAHRALAVAGGIVLDDVRNAMKPLTRRVGLRHAYDDVRYTSGINPNNLSRSQKSGRGKLAHIIARPEDFVLNAEQRAAVKLWQEAENSWFDLVNRARDSAGLPKLARTEQNYFFTQFTKESLEATFGKSSFAYLNNQPYFTRELPFEMQRKLGRDVVEAMQKYPKLELIDDPLEMMDRSINLKSRAVSNALVTKVLKEAPDVASPDEAYPILLRRREVSAEYRNMVKDWRDTRLKAFNEYERSQDVLEKALKDLPPETRVARPEDLEGIDRAVAQRDLPDSVYRRLESAQQHYANYERLKAEAGAKAGELKPVRQELKDLNEQYKTTRIRMEDLHPRGEWGKLGGISDTYFRKEVLESVESLSGFLDDQAMNHLDWLTNELRTVMFNLDASAWTIQGYMSIVNSPSTFIANSPQLMAASVFGNDFASAYMRKNLDKFVTAAARGVVLGREFGKLQESAFSYKLPLFKALDQRGFQAYLPMVREQQFRAMVETEAMVERMGWAGKAPGIGEVTRLALDNLEYLPPALAAFVASEDGIDDWEKVMIAAIGVGSIGAFRGLPFGSKQIPGIKTKIANATFDNLSKSQKAKVEIRSARAINRTSGVINKQAAGITQRRSMIERNFIFRSPGLSRNALTLARHALSNPGPEGQMARAHLVKLAAVTTATLAGLEYMATGEWPSLDPRDENSILNPERFLKADLGELGRFAPSNPMISLARALMYQEFVQGAEGWGADRWDPATGMAQFFQFRTPDVAGRFLSEGIQQVRPTPDFPDEPTLVDNKGLTATREAIERGDWKQAVIPLLRTITPVEAQSALETGIIPNVGDHDPAYQTNKEKVWGVLLSMYGGNFSPQTLSQQYRRELEEEAQTLGDEETGTWDGSGPIPRLLREKILRRRPDLADLQELVGDEAEARALLDEEPNELNRYYGELDIITNRRDQDLRDIESRVNDGLATRSEYREERRIIMQAYQTSIDNLRTKYDEVALGRDVIIEGERITPSVTEYVDKYAAPEDRAVSDYYNLFDKATDRGELDFDKLEELQADFMLRNPHADYVQSWLARQESTITSPLELERRAAVEITEPFWELREDVWGALAEHDFPLMQSFATYDDFRDAVRETARERGMREADVLTLVQRHPEMRVYEDVVQTLGRIMRSEDPLLDIALEEWYDRAIVDPIGATAARYGDESYLGQSGGAFVEQPMPHNSRLALNDLFRQHTGQAPDPNIFGDLIGITDMSESDDWRFSGSPTSTPTPQQDWRYSGSQNR